MKRFPNEVELEGVRYRLFFSNHLAPLIALNYADQRFFEHFERLCGARYRILSIIQEGWQQKFGRVDDIAALKAAFLQKASREWAKELLKEYEERQIELRNELKTSRNLKTIRELAAPLDAMSNMLHLFAELLSAEFIEKVKQYSNETQIQEENILYYTQPIKESERAKLLIEKPEKKIELSETELAISSLLRLGAYVKDDVRSLLEERKQSITLDEELTYLQIEEIQTGKKELIASRKELTIIWYPEREMLILEGEKAKEILSKIVPITPKQQELLHGQVASTGKATGKAIVVQNSIEACEKMEEGAILIAPYTAVEYLPAMKKAAAIVTETGGITSHAAIVSREMKIPCVIGVKDATTNFSNGDLVEVDAKKGIVRKVES